MYYCSAHGLVTHNEWLGRWLAATDEARYLANREHVDIAVDLTVVSHVEDDE